MIMKEYSTLLKSPELKPHHQMQFSIILRIHHFFGGRRILPPFRGYSQYILSITDRIIYLFLDEALFIIIIMTRVFFHILIFRFFSKIFYFNSFTFSFLWWLLWLGKAAGSVFPKAKKGLSLNLTRCLSFIIVFNMQFLTLAFHLFNQKINIKGSV